MLPQGLKPRGFVVLGGTAEAVPSRVLLENLLGLWPSRQIALLCLPGTHVPGYPYTAPAGLRVCRSTFRTPERSVARLEA